MFFVFVFLIIVCLNYSKFYIFIFFIFIFIFVLLCVFLNNKFHFWNLHFQTYLPVNVMFTTLLMFNWLIDKCHTLLISINTGRNLFILCILDRSIRGLTSNTVHWLICQQICRVVFRGEFYKKTHFLDRTVPPIFGIQKGRFLEEHFT